MCNLRLLLTLEAQHMKNVLILLSTAVILTLAINLLEFNQNLQDHDSAALAINAASGEKIAVCHIPPGNPDNAHTIVISINALHAHLAHGDSIGGCSEQGDDGPVGDNGEDKENPNGD